MSTNTAPLISADLDQWLVRYRDLRPCTTAFIDTRSPGSDQKENFTIIGPGVAENPDQHVHIRRPHGFNIGGARQPPRCVNSQHFHETAEVFLIHSGTWAFRTGENADEGEIILTPGDVISIPTHIFRGFENVGEDKGFLYAVLGGDDAGHVVWAPSVLDKARNHGLLLTTTGRLVDTIAGDALTPDEELATPLSPEALAACVRHADSAALEAIVVRKGAGSPSRSPLAAPGVEIRDILGAPGATGRTPPLEWPHGFCCQMMTLLAGSAAPAHSVDTARVAFLQSGSATISFDDVEATLEAGDTLSLPVGAVVRIKAGDRTGAQLFVTLNGDFPPEPKIFHHGG